MNLSDLIYSTTQPFSALRRELTIANWIYLTRSLAFNMQAQTESNWCWAATSTSVSHFYWSWSSWTQCKVAGAELNLNNCCQSPTSGPCNVPWYLDKALTRTRNFVSYSGPISFDQVRAEIDAGRPVGARIGWSGGGGHFVAIYGYTRVSGIFGNRDYFDIDDPIYGKSHPLVSDFSNNYQGSGTWTTAYFTKSYTPLMKIHLLEIELDILKQIEEVRPLLGVKAGTPPEAALATQGRSLGLGHAIFTLGLHELAKGEHNPQWSGVRVLELAGETPRAFYDVVGTQVSQMSGSSPYLELFARALEVATGIHADERRFEARLLRAPALNFEALWLHADDGEADRVIPLRGFHGFAPMQPVPYREALERLRGPAEKIAQQDEMMGA